MTFGDIILLCITVLVMLVGLLGTFLPLLPGIPLIWLAALGYSAVTGFYPVGWNVIFWFGVIMLASFAIDALAQAYGTKRYGASRWGVVGSLVGTLLGFPLGLIGLIFGPLAGAFVFELLGGRHPEQALRAGIGSFLGFLGGSLIKVIMAAVMIGIFIFVALSG